MCTSVDDVSFYNTNAILNESGILCPIESGKDIPFDIKRVFYVYGVANNKIRGKHAHIQTKQLLICLSGKVKVICKDENKEVSYLLESPQQALYIPEMIWDEQVYTTEDTVLLVLSNTEYNQSDYIHDFNQYKKLKGDME
tara:strand:+ start:387 stop:806 length:420 start_codon:yes stop_codon:yes gene_type:complete